MYVYEDWVSALPERKKPQEFLDFFGVDGQGFHDFMYQAFENADDRAAMATGIQIAFEMLQRKGIEVRANEVH